ncbi:MAG: hypothetical protein LBC99_06315 [Spirochaetota bacterium]|jgi:hypothetical protein|nr:hypothetical protein [Spirochaetota bacterium]
MKKFLVVCLALMFISSVLVADDAKVMPARVGRLYIAPIFGSADTKYDQDGNKTEFDKISFFNLGFALEYGVIDWITAAIQWTPGVTLSSDILGALPEQFTAPTSLGGMGVTTANMNDMADLFVGAKFQIVGPKAPVISQQFRAAVAAGVAIPLTSGPDFSEEIAAHMADLPNGGTGAVTLNKMDNHSFAAGWRAYFDILLGKKFFLNFYNETMFYLQKRDLFKYDTGHALVNTVGGGVDELAGTINYQYKTTFEFEPVFETTFGPSVGFTAGLPVNFVSTPKYIYEYDSPVGEAIAGAYGIQDGFAHQTLKVTPGVQVFFYKTPLPIELKAQYAIPLYVRNGTALSNLVFQLRIYFMI